MLELAERQINILKYKEGYVLNYINFGQNKNHGISLRRIANN